MRRQFLASLAVVLGLIIAFGAPADDKKKLYLVADGPSPFWRAAEEGVKKAQAELPNYELAVKYPEQQAAAIQERVMDDLIAAGAAGIMVSPVDSKTESDYLNRARDQVVLFTTGVDAPNSQRAAYVGSSDVLAGQQAAEIMQQAMPDGGKCMGYIGQPGDDHAKARIQAVRDKLKGSKIELVDVRGDDFDQTRAKRNVEDTLTANPDINCMVGFYSYNTPQIYAALKDAGMLGKIKVIGFGNAPETLAGIKEGSVAGTVVEQPFEWGYQGMKAMARFIEGDKSAIPDNRMLIIPTLILDAHSDAKALGCVYPCSLDSSGKCICPQ